MAQDAGGNLLKMIIHAKTRKTFSTEWSTEWGQIFIVDEQCQLERLAPIVPPTLRAAFFHAKVNASMEIDFSQVQTVWFNLQD